MIKLHNTKNKIPPIGECVLAKIAKRGGGPRYYIFNVIKVNEEIWLEEAGGEQYVRIPLQYIEGWITLDELDRNIDILTKEDYICTIPTATKPLRAVLSKPLKTSLLYGEPKENKEVPVFTNGKIEKREAQVITINAEDIPLSDWDGTYTFTFGENDYENNDLTTFCR